MATQIKFRCTSCQHVFRHDAYQKSCFCPKCGGVSERCPEEEQTITCNECGTEVPLNVLVCPTCGCPMSAAKGHCCSECGIELNESAHVCPQCGCPVEAPGTTTTFPSVSITQTASPLENEELELSLPPQNKALYWFIGGMLLVSLIGFGVVYYATDWLKETTTNESVVGDSRYVVINGVNLRLRYAPFPDADTFKWSDGTNRHPEKGERYPYLGEEGEFYKINYKGYILYVSKQHAYIE